MPQYDAWGISIHHAWGGAPFWVLHNAHRNDGETEHHAYVAGWRLRKVLGGAFGHIAIDPGWFAYYTRCNEVAIVATYKSSADIVNVVHTAESVKLAVIDAVGGKLSDVTLVALSRVNVALHLSLRRVILGFSRLRGISNAKFDLLSAQISPDPPSDDKTLTTLRAANDTTNDQLVSQLHAFIVQRSNRNDNFSESVRNMRIPTNCFPADNAKNVRMSLFAAVADLSLSSCAQPNSALTNLIPDSSALKKLCTNDLALPGLDLLEGQLETNYYSDFVNIDVQDTDMSHILWDNTPRGETKEKMPLRVTQSPFTAEANEFFITSVTTSVYEDAVTTTHTPVPVRIAARVNETVTYVSDARVEWAHVTDSGPRKNPHSRLSSQITGVVQLRYVYVNTLAKEVQEAGHGPLRFILEWETPYPLESMTLLVPGQIPMELDLPEYKDGKHRITLPLVLPALQPNASIASLGSMELSNIEYKYKVQSLPSILRAQANARYTLTRPTQPTQPLRHQFVDIAVRSFLSPHIKGTPTQVQFMVQVPDIPIQKDETGIPITKLGSPMMKPTGNWIAERRQILWSLSDRTSQPDSTANDVATVASHFYPGKPAELIARIPIRDGRLVDPAETAQFSATRPCMLQARFHLVDGSIVPVTLRAKPVSPAYLGKGQESGIGHSDSGSQYQLENSDERAMNRYLSVKAEELLLRSFSTVKTQFHLSSS